MLNKLFRKENIFQSAMISLISTILQRVILSIGGIFFARLLGPQEYGIYSLVFFFIPLVVSLGRFGITSSFTRYIPQYEKKGMLKNFLKRAYTLSFMSCLVVVLTCVILAGPISKVIFAMDGYESLILLSCLCIMPYLFFDNLTYTFNGMRIFKLSSALMLFVSILTTAFGILFVVHIPKVTSILFAIFISYMAGSVLFYFLLKSILDKQSDQKSVIQEPDFYSKLFSFSIWFVLVPIVDQIFKFTDRLILNRFMGLEEVGIYSVAINISGFLFMFGSILGNVNMPSLSKKWEEGSRQEVFDLFNLNIKINAFCLIVFSGFLILFKEQFVSLLYGRLYLDCLPVLPLTLIYSILYSISWTIGGYASLIEKTYIPLITTAMGLGINVLFNLYLIPKFGLIGAAISSLLAFSINLLSLFIWYTKEGFEIQKGTLWITASTVLLFFNGLYIVLAILLFVCMTLSTSIIFNLNEKNSIHRIIVKSRPLSMCRGVFSRFDKVRFVI